MSILPQGYAAYSVIGDLHSVFAILVAVAVGWLVAFKVVFTRQLLRSFLHGIGVSLRRLARVVREVRRKSFHLLGLFVPTAYYLGLHTVARGPGGDEGAEIDRTRVLFSRSDASALLGATFAVVAIAELLRKLSPSFNGLFVRVCASLLRPKEANRATGVLFYSCGCFLAVYLFKPVVAISSMLFLVLGDAAAALVGMSYGKIRISARKSLEGTLACLTTCFVIGLVIFARVLPMSIPVEYIAFAGALGATIGELFPYIDDNVTIPVLSGVCMTLSLLRLGVYEAVGSGYD